MRGFFAAIVALATIPSGAARATDYLYTFTGIVSYANNYDATDIYANAGDPIVLSLRVKDSLRTAAYVYGPTGSSAIGGPDYANGTLFPVDRKVFIDPDLGYAADFTPLETGFRTDENYSASISKSLPAGSLAIDMDYQRYIPPDPYCTERCSGTRIAHYASVQAFSDAFGSPDFRETGSFDLTAGSTATIGDVYATYLSFGDYYTIDLSHLTVQRLFAAGVPESSTWAMMLTGFGLAGIAMRGRRRLRVHVIKA